MTATVRGCGPFKRMTSNSKVCFLRERERENVVEVEMWNKEDTYSTSRSSGRIGVEEENSQPSFGKPAAVSLEEGKRQRRDWVDWTFWCGGTGSCRKHSGWVSEFKELTIETKQAM